MIPTLYGGYHRKKWAYYIFLISLGLNSLVYVMLVPFVGIIVSLIYVVPNFIYYTKRKKLFSNYDGRFENYTSKENLKDVYENIVNPMIKTSNKLMEDYQVKEKLSDTLEKSKKLTNKIIKDYEIDKKFDSVLDITKSKLSDVVQKTGLVNDSNSINDKLRDLKALLDDGIINNNEFEQKKSELLKKF